MCFSSESKTENAVYIISTIMLFFAVMLLPFAKPQYSALICCLVILTIVITLAVSDGSGGSGGSGGSCAAAPSLYPYSYRANVAAIDDDTAEGEPVRRLAAAAPPPRARLCPLLRPRPLGSPSAAAAAASAADVPGNVWGQAVTCSSDACADDDPAILLPVVMEGSAASRDDAPQCGGGVQVLSNLPPFPGVVAAALNGNNGVWRLPEWPADQPSREGTIAAVVSDLPECAEQTPRDIIRNKGLYGIKGNTSCDLLKRSAVADAGFIQPIGARNAFLAYDSYDQLHAKDQFLIPIITPQKF